jgi:hypothetical protein
MVHPYRSGSTERIILPRENRFSMPNNTACLPSDHMLIGEPDIKKEETSSELGSMSENDKEQYIMDSSPQPEVHQDPPYLYRPVARISAFRPYNHHYAPAIKPSGMGCTVADNGSVEQQVPSKCGYGCCSSDSRKEDEICRRRSLIGPNFMDYEETAPIMSHELTSVMSDISSIAWIKSGLQSGITSSLMQPVLPTGNINPV